MKKSSWILLCDESGAKGFTDQPAGKDTPIGVVAGVLAPQESYEELLSSIQKITEPHKRKDGKFHITDLDHQTQNTIRNSVFDLLESMGCAIVYEAVQHDRAHQAYLDEKKNIATLDKASKRKGIRYNFGDPKQRLLTLLFAGCLNRAHLHLTEELKISDELELSLLTDNMDEALLKEIKSKTEGTFFFRPNVEDEITVSRFHTETKTVETKTGTVQYEIKTSEETNLSKSSAVTLSITIDDTCSIVPDCLANSFLHNLTTVFAKQPNCRLSSTEAISAHQLSKQIVATADINSALYDCPIPVIEDADILTAEYLKLMGKRSFVEKRSDVD